MNEVSGSVEYLFNDKYKFKEQKNINDFQSRLPQVYLVRFPSLHDLSKPAIQALSAGFWVWLNPPRKAKKRPPSR